MTGLSDDAKAVVVFTSRLGDAGRPALSPTGWHRLIRRLADAGLSPANLFSTVDIGLDEEEKSQIDRLVEDAPRALLALDALSRRGIWVRTIVDDSYPGRLRSRLGDNAPPLIFGVGDPGVLAQGGVGVVGSRNVSPEALEVAGKLALQAVRLGLGVVSGAARGVDQVAMDAAYSAGGWVVGVVADSLVARVRHPEVLEAVDSGRTCLVTGQHPDAGFSVGAAMGRNKVIYGLADLTVVVAAEREQGGTWASATEARRSGYGRVVVWSGAGRGPGNEALVDLGLESLDDVAALDLLASRQLSPHLPEQMTLL